MRHDIICVYSLVAFYKNQNTKSRVKFKIVRNASTIIIIPVVGSNLRIFELIGIIISREL